VKIVQDWIRFSSSRPRCNNLVVHLFRSRCTPCLLLFFIHFFFFVFAFLFIEKKFKCSLFWWFCVCQKWFSSIEMWFNIYIFVDVFVKPYLNILCMMILLLHIIAFLHQFSWFQLKLKNSNKYIMSKFNAIMKLK
jgi:hypothetical protein